MKLTTSFALLRSHGACKKRYRHLRRALGPDWGDTKPIPLLRVLEENGLEDTLWALQAVPEKQAAARDIIARLFAADCAAYLLHLFEAERPDDTRPRNCIIVARRFVNGEATQEELAVARAAAKAASWAVTKDSSWEAARAAAWAASRDVAGAAVGDVAEDEREWQTALLAKYLRSSTLPRPIPLPRIPKAA